MKFILFAFLAVGLLAVVSKAQMPPIEPGVSQELAKWRAARYSDVRYKLNLTLEKMSPVLKGTIEIRVKMRPQAVPPASAGGGTPIVLDWRKIKGFEDRSTVGNVSVNGKPVTVTSTPPAYAGSSAFEHNEHLIFREGVVIGENVIKLDFTSPILPSGSAITRYVDKEDGAEYIYSLFVPSDASTAFPVFDQPDLKARFTLQLNAPTEWTKISNSEFESMILADENCPMVEVQGGSTVAPPQKPLPKRERPLICDANITWNFKETKPISTYVFAFAAGPFERVAEPAASAGGEAPVGKSTSASAASSPPAHAGGTALYVRRSQAEKFKPHAAEVFRLNREAIKYFEEYFDYKFPFPKYDLVLIPEFPFGGMEHVGATFLRESAVIFPQEPTKNDHISRATLIFHEAAHQWFGDTVTMRWFDDLWLKEGFATFTAYKALERIMPEMNAWKIFYERVKQAAYQTDSTKGTTPIYQEIKNLSAAKSAYGAIVYNKAPAFLRQAEFYLGEDKFRTAVRAFLKKHEFKNASWQELVKEFETAGWQVYLKDFAHRWIQQKGLPVVKISYSGNMSEWTDRGHSRRSLLLARHTSRPEERLSWLMNTKVLTIYGESGFVKRDHENSVETIELGIVPSYNPPNYNSNNENEELINAKEFIYDASEIKLIFPNYQDYGYGIFLLDEKSRDYVLKNIQNEKDPFLRAMMWGSLWDSVREGELDPREYVELAVKNLQVESDESTIQSLLGRVSTAINYYLPAEKAEPPASAGGGAPDGKSTSVMAASLPPAHAGGTALNARLETVLIERMRNAETLGQRITYYRAFLNTASSEKARALLKDILNLKFEISDFKLKTKDKFDIVTRLLILGDPEAEKLLAELEKTETSDDAKRYAYVARAGIGTAKNKAKYWADFTANKEISESWIEAAFGPWNSIRHSELTLPYLQKALQELPNHKRSRKIFFVNGWLAAFIGGQRSEEALAIVNKFLADNPNLDRDLRLKILENVDIIERAVRIRGKYRL